MDREGASGRLQDPANPRAGALGKAPAKSTIPRQACGALMLACLMNEDGDKQRSDGPELFARAAALIRQAYGDSAFTLGDVAVELGVSVRQLQRVFAEVGETTFRDFLEDVRMRRARELLARGEYPSRRVAEHVGYRGGAAFRKSVQALPRVRALRVPRGARSVMSYVPPRELGSPRNVQLCLRKITSHHC